LKRYDGVVEVLHGKGMLQRTTIDSELFFIIYDNLDDKLATIAKTVKARHGDSDRKLYQTPKTALGKEDDDDEN
jgi:hypothetical protein